MWDRGLRWLLSPIGRRWASLGALGFPFGHGSLGCSYVVLRCLPYLASFLGVLWAWSSLGAPTLCYVVYLKFKVPLGPQSPPPPGRLYTVGLGYSL